MKPQRIETDRQIQDQVTRRPMSYQVEARVNQPVWRQVRRNVNYQVLAQLHEVTREAATN